MGVKKHISKWIRYTGLAAIADRLRFYVQYGRNYVANRVFVNQHPGFVFPPAYFLYETYELNYQTYLEDGLQTAKEIIELAGPFLNNNHDAKTILDWGCGPGRVVRHIPSLVKNTDTVIGSDYNQDYINWCSKNLPSVTFIKNELEPPMALQDNAVDLIYALSIITHLSAGNHIKWIAELLRISKPGGLLLITSQGDCFKDKLMPDELSVYNRGELVVRATEQEGHRVFAAFEPAAYMQQLFSGCKILKFIKGGSPQSIHGMQDTWLVQKAI